MGLAGSMRKLALAIVVIAIVLPVFVMSVEAVGDSWVFKTPLPLLVKDVAAVGINGKIYAMGYNYTYNNQTSAYGDSTFNYLYTPSSDRWVSKRPMPNNQSQFAVASYQNKIYVIGGWTKYESPSLATNYVTGAVQAYDVTGDSWENRTSIPTPRANLQAAVVDGKIFLIGGRLQNGADTNTNEAYNPSNDSWTEMSPIPNPVSNYGLAVVENQIYVMGGGDGGKFGNAINSVQIYNPQTDAWAEGTYLPVAVGNVAATAIGEAGSWKIYVIGVPNQYFNTNSKATMQIYDLQTKSWANGTSIPAAGYVSFSAITIGNTFYAVGGRPFAWFMPGLFPTVNEQYYPLNSETTPSTTSTLNPVPTQNPTTILPTVTPSTLPTESPADSPTKHPTVQSSPSPTAPSLAWLAPNIALTFFSVITFAIILILFVYSKKHKRKQETEKGDSPGK